MSESLAVTPQLIKDMYDYIVVAAGEFQDLIWINSHSGQRQYPI